ncbi:MAG: enoyl-CoA hydratase [Comamonadaceae bacterium]|nr:MAG: enoyl-CoA hydratase [Comamonadaceae bacterium]
MAGIVVRREGAVGYVLISNPEKFNAMTTQMWDDLPRQLAALDADPAVRVIVLSGDGERAFVSGADISQFEAERADASAQLTYKEAVDAACLAPLRTGKPVIARIRGVCMGGGLGLALGCDLRICSDDARFRMPAARLGLGYDEPGVHRFAALIGVQNTCDIFFSARTFDAQDALRMGFVSRVVPAGRLDAEVDQLVAQMAENAPLTIRAAKLAVRSFLGAATASSTPEVQAAIEACNRSADYREGVKAFGEKRKPQFAGH